MGFKIKNSLTGEFEKLPILTLKGEKGETGGVEEYNKVDYMGNKYETLKQANDANVEYAVKTAIGEFNYLDYEGQHITATDTIEGRAKSAILSGCTLVNYVPNYTFTRSRNANSNDYKPVIDFNFTLTKGKKYFVRANITKNTFTDGHAELYFDSQTTNQHGIIVYSQKTGIFSSAVTVNIDGVYRLSNMITNHTTDGEVEITDFVILEYQEGMENWDIPYFEGMKSVQMPVLTTTGKNLIDINTLPIMDMKNCEVIDGIVYKKPTTEHEATRWVMPVKPNTTYTISAKGSTGTVQISNFLQSTSPEFDSRIFLSQGGSSVTFTTSSHTELTLSIFNSEVVNFEVSDIQLEYGTQATPYEPYKSNILTVNEPVELRAIGKVKDELNLLTGELTQRIGEVVLDGSQNLDIQFNTNSQQPNTAFVQYSDSRFEKGEAISCTLPKVNDDLWGVSSYDNQFVFNYLYYSENNKKIQILIPYSMLKTIDKSGVKQFLSENPIKILLPITESIKTVDLSDNVVYSYDEVTHYDCSSAEGSLVPTLSVKVPTDVQATIAQQRETIQTLNSENERLNQIQEALKASMLDSQVQLMNLSWDTDFEVFTLRESIAPKGFSMDSKTGSNIDKFSQAKFIIENDCPDLEKLNSQIEYYFSKDVFSQEQFEELTDLISIVKGENGCEY